MNAKGKSLVSISKFATVQKRQAAKYLFDVLHIFYISANYTRRYRMWSIVVTFDRYMLPNASYAIMSACLDVNFRVVAKCPIQP